MAGGREMGNGGVWAYQRSSRIDGTSSLLFSDGSARRATCMQKEMHILTQFPARWLVFDTVFFFLAFKIGFLEI